MATPHASAFAPARAFRRSTGRGLAVFGLDAVGYGLALAGSQLAPAGWMRAACSLAAGFMTGMLFVVGHDACHQSLTASRALNAFVGRIAFLPSLHPYSLWDLGHNQIHHRHTNQRGRDYVWEPLSRGEYGALPWRPRAAYRFFRSAPGHLAYYAYAIWWRRMFYPRRHDVTPFRRDYAADLALVTAWIVALPSALAYASLWRHAAHPSAALPSTAEALLLGCAVPLAFYWALASTLTYLHHTHPSVRWSARDDDPGAYATQLEGSVHVILPGPLNWLFHRIMEHTAHHLRPGIPLYHLDAAQRGVEADHPGRVITYRWTPRTHLRILAACKLYETDGRGWTDFAGHSTTTGRAMAVGSRVQHDSHDSHDRGVER